MPTQQMSRTQPTPRQQAATKEYEERRDLARNANLVDYFKSHGYETKQHGREVHVKGFGGLNINIDTNKWYRFSDDKGGYNAIDCLKNVFDMDYKTAVNELIGYASTTLRTPQTDRPQSQQGSKKFVLPERASDDRRVIAFLTKTRKIPSEVVIDLIKKGNLYQEAKRGNAIFLHRDKDGNPIGAEIQGTATRDKDGNQINRFKGVAIGTHISFSEVKIVENPKKIYVFESAIDLMSFMARCGNQKLKEQQSNLISMNGLKPNILEQCKQKYPNAIFISGTDNDEHGKTFDKANGLENSLTAYLKNELDKNQVKDWNELAQFNYAKANGLEFHPSLEPPFDETVNLISSKENMPDGAGDNFRNSSNNEKSDWQNSPNNENDNEELEETEEELEME